MPRMKPIHLDLHKLYGFKIVARDIARRAHAPLGAKVGVKLGEKVGVKAPVRLGAKLGQKEGVKAR